MSKNNFKIKNDFYYRYPYFSIDFYEENILGNIENIQELVNKEYGENILVSSKELYEANKQKINSKNKNSALYKYLLRGSVRTTPYGLNAGVAQGYFSDKNNLLLYEKNQKKVRPDIEWLSKIIKKCEKELDENLMVIAGDCHFKEGFRLVKYYDSCYVKDRNRVQVETKINYTNLVQLILDITKDKYISIADIIKELLNIYEINQKDKILVVLKSLIDNEYLYSNLKVSLLSDNPFVKFLEILNQYNVDCTCFNRLKEISILINNYNEMPIGESDEYYKKILICMEKICSVNNYLQIDMYNESKITLNQNIKNDIQEFGNFIMKWCISETYNDYIKLFREKYGEQAILLRDVFNSDIGLGFPEEDKGNVNQYREWWGTILLNYIINNKNENSVDLNKIINNFTFEFNMKELKFPLSFELSLYILNNSEDSNQEFNYIVSPMFGSETKWKSYGRFDYLFNTSLIKNDNNNSTKGFKEVEITFYPSKSHDANVSICNFNKPAYLEFNTHNLIEGKDRIQLDDIYMFIDKNSRISYIQGSTDEVLSFSTTNKYITDAFPKILKYIMETEKKQKPSFETFFYSLGRILNNLSGHIPEIRYKSLIISQEFWKINIDDYKENGKYIDFYKFKKLINDMILNKKLPQNICTGPIDRKLILNLMYDEDLNILYDMLKKTPNLQITKNIFNKESLILKDLQNKKYLCEFVFQFEQNIKSNTELIYSSKRIPKENYSTLLSYKSLPFCKWVTIKLYVNEKIEDKLLINQIRETYANLKIKNLIDDFFFIRYSDPNNHLRLRFKISDNCMESVLKELNALVKFLSNMSLLNDICYSSYEPEVNRYGGEECISLAEKLFGINSIISIDLIEMVDKKISCFSKEGLFLIATYKMIHDMGIVDEEILEYIKRYKLNRKYNKASNEIKNEVVYFFEQKGINYCLRERNETINLLTILDKGALFYNQYWEKVNEIYDGRDYDNFIVKRYCINSVIHMFFNRLIGMDRNKENLLMGVLEKLIYSKIQRSKNYAKKE